MPTQVPNVLTEVAAPVDDLFKNLMGFVDKHYYQRKFLHNVYWDYWKGDQRKYQKKYPGELDVEYMTRIENSHVENHCRPTSNINVAYMYGMADKISRRAEDPLLHKLLNEDVYDLNHMPSLMVDARLMASVIGFSVIEPMVFNKLTRKPFNPEDSITEKTFSVFYSLTDSTTIIPLPRVYDRRTLGMIIKYYEIDNIDSFKYLGLTKEFDTSKEYRVLEYVDDDLWLRWIHPKNEPEQKELLPVFQIPGKENINIYGDVRIPFVVFKNYGDPMHIEGESDIEDVIPLQLNLNERLTDDANIIRYHALPIIKALRGAKLPKNFVRKPNMVLEFDGEGDMDYLTWDAPMDASDKYKAQLRQSLAQSSQVSTLSRGNLRDVGQLKTGIGVKSLYVPDILGVRLRRPFALRAEKELILATAKMYEHYTNIKFSSYRSEVIYPEDFIGIDEWMETQVTAAEIAAGLPIQDRLKTRYPDKSDKEIEELARVVMEEAKKSKQPKQTSPSSERKQAEKE